MNEGETAEESTGRDWIPIILTVSFLGFLAFLAVVVIQRNSGLGFTLAAPAQSEPKVMFVPIPESLKNAR